MEEKFEDEEDMRERTKSIMNSLTLGDRLRSSLHTEVESDLELTLQELFQLAKQHSDMYPQVVETLKGFTYILGYDAEQ